jgi:hypothetical protein
MVPGWLDSIEDEVATCLRKRGSLSPGELAGELGLKESSALSYILLLAATGRLAIERVGLVPAASEWCRRRSDQVAA